MLRSKFSFIFILVLTAACSIPTPEKRNQVNDDAGATFFLQSSSGRVVGQDMDTKISIPLAKTFSFNACLKETRRQKNITNHTFLVTIDGQDKKLTSDANGCITWQERVEYNHLLSAAFVEHNRKITALGFQKGSRTASFALNPWEDTVHSLLTNTVPNLVSSEQAGQRLKSNGMETRSLWLDDLRLNVEESEIGQNGEIMSFEFQTAPKVEVVKATGQKVLEQLTYGDFQLSAYLIHAFADGTEQKEVRRPLTLPVTKTARINKGVLAGDVQLSFGNICTMGRLQLALKVTPIDTKVGLKSFEGVYIVKDCNSLKGSTFSRLKSVFITNDGNLTLDQYLTSKEIAPLVTSSSDPQFSEATDQPDYYLRNEVQVDQLTFSNVDFSGNNPIYRKMIFKANACLSMPVDQRPLRGVVFQVTTVDGRKIPVRSTNSGCISWDDSFEFNYVAPECWVEKSVRIEKDTLKFDQSFKVQVNPLNESQNFVRDIRFVHQLEKAPRCAPGKPELILTGFSFDTTKFDYDINEQLGLVVKKTGLFKIQPTLKLPSLTRGSGFRDGEAIPVGSYLLRWAMVDNSVTDYKQAKTLIYSVGKKIVQNPGNGTINDSITFTSENLKQLGNRVKILIEVVPLVASARDELRKNPSIDPETLVDYDLDLTNNTFEGVLILASNWEGPTLRKLETKERSLILHLETVKMFNDMKQADALKAQAQKNAVAKESKLEILNLNIPGETENLRRSMVDPLWWNRPAHQRPPTKLEPLDINLMKAWVRTGQPSEEVGIGLCKYWFYDHFQRPLRIWDSGQRDYQGKPLTRELTPISRNMPTAFQLTSQCTNAFRKDPSSFFDIEYFYFVHQPKLVRDSKGQVQVTTQIKDLSLNSQFSMSKSQSTSVSQYVGWDVSVGLSIKSIPFVSIGSDLRYGISKSWTDSESQSTSNSYSAGIGMTLESLNFKIQSQGLEKCAIIKLASQQILGENALVSSLIDHRLTAEEKAKVLSKGLMVCEGQPTMKPMEFTESYHVLNQKMPSAQIADTAADSSRPFFFALRGDSDLFRLISFLGVTFAQPQDSTVAAFGSEMSGAKLQNFFLNATPTQPGMIIRKK